MPNQYGQAVATALCKKAHLKPKQHLTVKNLYWTWLCQTDTDEK